MSQPNAAEYGVSKHVSVLGSRIHYIEVGEGSPPVVLLHGIPAHAGLWRKVLPCIAPHARTLAIDLIG